MSEYREDSVYATRFAVMQQQINEKDKRIKELEEEKQKYIVQLTDEQYRNLVDSIREEAKQEFEQKVKDEIEALRKMLKATTEGKLQEYTPEEIIIKINTLEDLLEDK